MVHMNVHVAHERSWSELVVRQSISNGYVSGIHSTILYSLTNAQERKRDERKTNLYYGKRNKKDTLE